MKVTLAYAQIDISAVMQKKDCRMSRGYATTNINSVIIVFIAF